MERLEGEVPLVRRRARLLTGLLYPRFMHWLSLPSAPWQVALLALVMSLPAITMGLVADDYELALAVTRDPLSAYAFFDSDPVQRQQALLDARAKGMAPWWIDPDFHQRFLRPLSSLSLALDFRLFPHSALPLHLENSVLYAVIVLIVAELYRALGLRWAHLGLATFFFAMHPAQSMTVGWIAGRNTLLATLFGLLAVLLHVTHLRTHRTSYALAAPAALALALASAEAGIAALGYAFAFSWVDGAVQPEDPARVVPGRSARLRTLSGLAFVAVLWQLVYRVGGYGVLRSGFYIDAASDPLRYLGNLLAAIPIYLASQLTLPYAASAGFAPYGVLWLAALSLAILAGMRRLWLPLVRRDARSRAFGLGAMLSVIPLGATLPQDRLVSFIAFGVCGLLAIIVLERLAPENQVLPRTGAKRLLVLHAVVGPALFIPYLFTPMTMSLGGGAGALADALGDDQRPVLLVNAPFYLPVHFFGQMRHWNKQPRPPIDLLYSGAKEVALARTDENSLELFVEGGYFDSTFERLERDPSLSPMHVGDEIELATMLVRVLAERDGKPTHVRFELASTLGDRRLFAWQGHKLEELNIPSVGETLQIARASGM
jgi:hypothetical protein